MIPLLRHAGRVRLGGAPPGHDARVLASLAGAGGPVIHISRDDAQMARMADCLGFFAPELKPMRFPSWDCLPYDRNSPRNDLVSERLATLAALADGVRPDILLTTANAFLQRVPPQAELAGSRFSGEAGGALDLEALLAFLGRHGYQRAETVMEPGEYAVRGGLVDLFPAGAAAPLRVDLFGDEIDEIRSFDPMDQRSTDRTERFDLVPASEVVLTRDSIARFREGYRAAFGAVTADDAIYEAVSAGRRVAGIEHWLPLFYDELETLADYLPEAVMVEDEQAGAARDIRFEAIADHYAARLDPPSGETPYRPLPPDRLYLDASGWEACMQDRPVAVLLPAAAPDGPDAGGRPAVDFSEARARPDIDLYGAVADRLAAHAAEGRRVLLAAYSEGSRDRLAGLLGEQGVAATPVEAAGELDGLPPDRLATAVLPLESGFESADLAIVTEQDILGERLSSRARGRRRARDFLQELSEIAEGDIVVHVEHGIGRYEGLETVTADGAPHDCLRIQYAGDGRLFVPVENIETLSRYGASDSAVALDRLGGVQWQARKARMKQRIRELADELIRVAAERALRPGETLHPSAGLYDEFAARFAFPETNDQLKAIEDVLEDLSAGRPMDRLICGDVGFGKTEVALRAAFVTAMSGFQVAVVAPTTLLVRQHFRTFQERFRGLPVEIGQLSRLVAAREARDVKDRLADGRLDIVIGTHALLAKSIRMKRLGLLVVDEEQHFGVAHKERLKQYRSNVHVLTLTATPIPRTLQLALAGVREMSLIATPPVDRLAVRTFVGPFDALVVREALRRELLRGGRCFYVCPRIRDLPEVVERLEAMMPDARVGVAHGGMASADLEAAVGAFYDGRVDVLVSTNIVESGLDIPEANTLIVHRADMFGLAQLYQLRGRIGRAKQRAYAYLTLPERRKLTKAAEKRLSVMQTLDTLGAGFQLASYDLDIRGAGNLLGDEQSGHIREVGIELYQHMLEEAIAAVRSGVGEDEEETAWTPQIGVGAPVLIPESYVADLNVRLSLYRRIAALEDRGQTDAFAAELIDRFGPVPDELENLLRIVGIKRLCREAGVERVDAGPKGAVVSFRGGDFANPAGLIDYIGKQAGTVRLRPDHKLVIGRSWEKEPARIAGTERLLRDLAAIASG